MPCRYEGTGRSLSLKLIQQLRSEGAKLSSGQDRQGSAGLGRTFREVQLQEPIRCTLNLFFISLVASQPHSVCSVLKPLQSDSIKTLKLTAMHILAKNLTL